MKSTFENKYYYSHFIVFCFSSLGWYEVGCTCMFKKSGSVAMYGSDGKQSKLPV
jgi:hypothetical protein